MPGEWYGGTVVLEPVPQEGNKGVRYSIAVSFGGEVHEFIVTQAASK